MPPQGSRRASRPTTAGSLAKRPQTFCVFVGRIIAVPPWTLVVHHNYYATTATTACGGLRVPVFLVGCVLDIVVF